MLSTMLVFLHDTKFYKHFNYQQSLSVSADLMDDNDYNTDDTIFNLRYENKVWSFSAKDFQLNSNIFSVDTRINNFGRNGTRDDKIKLINKLIKIIKGAYHTSELVI